MPTRLKHDKDAVRVMMEQSLRSALLLTAALLGVLGLYFAVVFLTG